MNLKKYSFLAVFLLFVFVLCACDSGVEDHDHFYGSWAPTEEPTCQNEGVEVGICWCGKTSERLIPNTSHAYDETVTQEPTCAVDGTKLLTCFYCGNQTTETIYATGDHSFAEQSRKEATCAADGEIVYECTSCGLKKTEPITATGNHNLDDGVVKIAATCGIEGQKERTCKVCGIKKTETIKKLNNHTYTKGVCDVCGVKDPNYVHIYSAGETWKVGDYEITVNSVTYHDIEKCCSYYTERAGFKGKYGVLVSYTYKYVGTSNKGKVFKSWISVYDENLERGYEYENNEIYCEHQKGADICFPGTKATAEYCYVFNNKTPTVNVYIDAAGKIAQFQLKVKTGGSSGGSGGSSGGSSGGGNTEQDKLNGCTIKTNFTLPKTINNYTSNGTLQSSVKITDITFEVKGTSLYFYFTGEKIYDSRGTGQSDSCKIGWKLYDSDGYLIDSGTEYTDSLAVGDKFKNSYDCAYDCIEAGETYTLEILNVN